MRFRRILYDMFHPLLRVVRTNRAIIRRTFGVRVPRGTVVQFDPTTILLAIALREIATPDDTTSLEIGIGCGALVSLSLARSRRVQITGVDLSPERVRTSREIAEFNGVEADFFTSDLFSTVSSDSRFDVLFFNPPYVPTETGRQLKLTERLDVDGDQVWDGGKDGTTVLREFLRRAPDYLSPAGRVVFGVQSIFVSDDTVCAVLRETGYTLTQRVTKRFVPSVVYVTRPCSSEDGQ